MMQFYRGEGLNFDKNSKDRSLKGELKIGIPIFFANEKASLCHLNGV